jgi:hypothetical protein
MVYKNEAFIMILNNQQYVFMFKHVLLREMDVCAYAFMSSRAAKLIFIFVIKAEE